MAYAYMAILDKEIERRQALVKKTNEELIKEFNKKPFFYKLFHNVDIQMMITANWLSFSRWVDKHMAEQSKKQRRLDMFNKEVFND